MTLSEFAGRILQKFDDLELAVDAPDDISFWTGNTTGVKTLAHGQQLYAFWAGRFKRPQKLTLNQQRGIDPVPLGPPVQSPSAVAFCIDFKFRSLKKAADYLNQNSIQADLVMVTRYPTYPIEVPLLPNDADVWQMCYQDFVHIRNVVWERFDNVDYHLFFNGPVALGIGLGSVWGHVRPATIYHMNNSDGNYYPLIRIEK